jgi:hypothetical protein
VSQPEHPSADRIADLLDGSLPAAEAMSVNAHLAGCAECSDVRSALVDVTAVLREEGAAEWTMPTDVAASLDEAIAGAAATRSAGGEVHEPRAGRRPVQRWRWLAGAAAAVTVVGIGVAGLHAISATNDNDAATTPAAPRAESANGAASAGAGKLGPTFRAPAKPHRGISTNRNQQMNGAPRLTAGKLPAEARRLAADRTRPRPPASDGCADPIGGGISTVISWEGHRAVLDVSPRTRTATVLDCATAVRPLYTTGF